MESYCLSQTCGKDACQFWLSLHHQLFLPSISHSPVNVKTDTQADGNFWSRKAPPRKWKQKALIAALWSNGSRWNTQQYVSGLLYSSPLQIEHKPTKQVQKLNKSYSWLRLFQQQGKKKRMQTLFLEVFIRGPHSPVLMLAVTNNWELMQKELHQKIINMVQEFEKKKVKLKCHLWNTAKKNKTILGGFTQDSFWCMVKSKSSCKMKSHITCFTAWLSWIDSFQPRWSGFNWK